MNGITVYAFSSSAGKGDEMLPEIPINDELHMVADNEPPPSASASDRRDSGLGSLGIDNLDSLLDAPQSQLPSLEVDGDTE